MINGKVWGSTQLLLSTPFLAIHQLVIKPNAVCSMHMHKYKWNCFYVVSGKLFIEVEKSSYALTDVTELEPGGFTTVSPGEFHRFHTGNLDTVALEMYYTEPLSEDIVRKNVGGLIDQSGG